MRSRDMRPVSRVTHGDILKIAIPMTLAHLSVPLIGLVDTAVIGQLGIAALIGGIAVGTAIFAVLFSTFNFLRSGTTGLTAQALGARRMREVQAVLVRGLITAIVLGLAFILLRDPIIALGLELMNPAPDVRSAAATYLHVRIWSAPFILLSYVAMGWLLGIARATTVMGLQILLAAINIALSLILVVRYDLGVAGVAWASVVAEIAVIVAAIPFIVANCPKHHRPNWGRILNRGKFLRLAGVNRDLMIRSLALLFALAFFTRQSAQFDTLILAANAILMQFFIISGYFLDGLATAAEQVIGRSVGAQNRPGFIRGLRLTFGWSLVLAGMLSGLFLAFGHSVIAIMTTAEDVRGVAGDYLIWAALTPIAGILAFQMDGVFIGATWSRDMRNMMLASLIVYLAAWAALTPTLGNHGLWLALIVFLAARGITMAVRVPARMRSQFHTPGQTL